MHLPPVLILTGFYRLNNVIKASLFADDVYKVLTRNLPNSMRTRLR